MKPIHTLATLLATAPLLLQDPGGLVPVAPGAQGAPPAPAPGPDVFVIPPADPVSPADQAAWRARLTEAAFDARAQALDEAAALARLDAAFRGQLERWADGQDELAWTAFLALRQADSEATAPDSPWLRDPFGQDPWSPPHGIPEDAFIPFTWPPDTIFGPGGLGWHFGGEDPFEGLFPEGGLRLDLDAGSFQGRSHSVELGPDGLEVRVQESGPDGSEERVYRAESIEALRAAEPELFAPGGALEGWGELRGLGRGPGLQHSGGQHPAPPLPGLPGGGLRPVQPPAPEVGGEVLRTDVLGVLVARGGEGDAAPSGGLQVESVVAGTIAAHVGLEAGDLVIEVAGARVRTAEEISAALAAVEPGAPVKVRWVDAQGTLDSATWTPPRD